MKWFGESWGAPLCSEEDRIETPVNEECFGCDKLVVEGEQGVVLPFMADKNDPRTTAPYHKDCFIRGILGDVI
jgi:hypothetical protein